MEDVSVLDQVLLALQAPGPLLAGAVLPAVGLPGVIGQDLGPDDPRQPGAGGDPPQRGASSCLCQYGTMKISDKKRCY